MTRFLLLFTTFLMSCTSLFAAPVDDNQALRQARQFILQRKSSGTAFGRASSAPVLSAVSIAGSDTYYYIYNVGQSDGYVIVSGDDLAPAILGFADAGHIDAASLPANMLAWLQGYADQIAFLRQHPGQASSPRQQQEKVSIAPLLNSQWGQDGVYNQQCPVYQGDYCLTGCTATAMAQVMYHYRYPDQPTMTIPGYKSNVAIYKDAIEPAKLDWDNMLPTYNGAETQEQQDAVAQLMVMCGSAIQTNFGPGGSSAALSDVAWALKKYFAYDQGTRYLMRNDYRENTWNNIIYDELAANRSVLYGGQSTGGGHSFVIDGYRNDGYYHVNWGWQGFCDGYYLLSVLNPGSSSGAGASSSSDGYSFLQEMIVGIQPDTHSEPAAPVLTCYSVSPVTYEYSRTASTETFKNVSFYYSAYNLNSDTYTFDLALALCDANEQIVATWPLLTAAAVPQNMGNNSSCTIDIDGTVAPGIYKFCCVCRLTGQEQWQPCDGSYNHYAEAIITETQLNFVQQSVSLSGTMNLSETALVGEYATFSASITNNGSTFNNDLYLFIDGQRCGGRHFEADAGETKAFEISYRPDAEGSHTAELKYLNNGYVSLATVTFTVEPAPAFELILNNPKVTNAVGGLLRETTAHIKLDVANLSDRDYNQTLRVYVLEDKGNGYYSGSRSEEFPVKIPALTKQSVTMDIDNLTVGVRYGFYISYKSEGKYYSINDPHSKSTGGYLVDPEGELPTGHPILDFDWDIAGMQYNDVLIFNSFVADITVTNQGATDYNEDLVLRLSESNGAYITDDTKTVSIKSGESQVVHFEIDGLENGHSYKIALYYVYEPGRLRSPSIYSFSVAGETTGITLAATGSSLPVTIHSMGGQLLRSVTTAQLSQALSALPHGLYIVRTSDGKGRILRN